MRCAVGLLALLAASGCDPEIGTGTYFCGPELFCPPNLECNPNDFTCELPGSFEAFSCPSGSQSSEPNESTSEALEIGELACNLTGAPRTLCISDFDDVDYVSFEVGDCFGSDPHVEVEIRYPVAMAPLSFDIVDENDDVITTGEPCTPDQNFTGMDWMCAQLPPTPGRYFVRVRATGDADCDGECRFNQYLLYVRFPVA